MAYLDTDNLSSLAPPPIEPKPVNPPFWTRGRIIRGGFLAILVVGGLGWYAAINRGGLHADQIQAPVSFTLGLTPNSEKPLKISAQVDSCSCQTVAFDFGDGTVTPQGTTNPFEHEYTSAGTYTVTATTEKDTLATQTITVTPLGWTGPFTLDSTTTATGSGQSIKLSLADNADQTIQAKKVASESSSQYSYSIAVKQQLGSGKLVGRINEFDSAGQLIAYPAPGNGRSLFKLFVGNNDWKVLSGSFITSAQTKSIQLQIQSTAFDNQVPSGTAWFDAVDIHRLPPEAASESTVQFPGQPSAFGMSITDVSGTNPITITTTKAIYSIFSDRIELYQKEGRRLLATAELPLGDLTLKRRDADVVVLAGHDLYLGIQADGVVVLENRAAATINISGNFKPDYAVDSKYTAYAVSDCAACSTDAESGTVFLADAQGGLAIYPEYVAPFTYEITKSYTNQDWNIQYGLSPNQRLLISTFPPREFKADQSVNQRLVYNGFDTRHGFDLNEDVAIDSWAQYANVMHIQLPWAGTDSWAGTTSGKSNVSPPYTAFDEAELRRIINRAHQNGMKVILYFSPASARLDSRSSDSANNAYIDTEPFLQVVKDTLTHYSADGAYFDGIYMEDDILDSWRLMRRAREVLGDKLIYLHATANVPFFNYRFGAPFVDTYADFTFKQENLPIASINDPLVRYMIGQYNVSNSIGTALVDSAWKHAVNGQNGLPFSNQKLTAGELINEALKRNFRIAWAVNSPRDDVASAENPGALLASYYQQLKPPTLTSFASSNILVGGSVQLVGTGFKPTENAVEVWSSDGTQSITAINHVSSTDNGTKISVDIPTTISPGSYRLWVITRDGIATAQLPFKLLPKLTNLTPAAISPGDSLTLTGAGFKPNENAVEFWNSDGTSIVGAVNHVVSTDNGTKITVTPPATLVPGSYRLWVNIGNELASDQRSFSLTKSQASSSQQVQVTTPKVTNLSPAVVTSSARVTMTGSGLRDATTVKLLQGGLTKATLSLLTNTNRSDTQRTFSAPLLRRCTRPIRFGVNLCLGWSAGLQPGAYQVTVTSPTGTSQPVNLTLR